VWRYRITATSNSLCDDAFFVIAGLVVFFLINEIIFTLLFRLPKTIEADQLLELQ